MALLSPEDHALVTQAVAKAERESDGEVVTIVAPQSDAYHDVGLHYAILAMLLVPATIAALPQSAIDRLTGLLLGWNAAPTRVDLMVFLFALMVLVFLIVRYANRVLKRGEETPAGPTEVELLTEIRDELRKR